MIFFLFVLFLPALLFADSPSATGAAPAPSFPETSRDVRNLVLEELADMEDDVLVLLIQQRPEDNTTKRQMIPDYIIRQVLGAFPIRIRRTLSGTMPTKDDGVFYGFFRNPDVMTIPSPPYYPASLCEDDAPSIVFATRIGSMDHRFSRHSLSPKEQVLGKEFASLGYVRFAAKHGIEENATNRFVEIRPHFTFLAGVSLSPLPVPEDAYAYISKAEQECFRQMSEQSRRLMSTIRLSPREISEMVYLLHWKRNPEEADARYAESRRGNEDVLEPVFPDSLSTEFGREFLAFLRKKEASSHPAPYDPEKEWKEHLARVRREEAERRAAIQANRPDPSKTPESSRMRTPDWGEGLSAPLLPCPVSAETKAWMDGLGLAAGRFKWPEFPAGAPRDGHCRGELSYLLFSPKKGKREKLPMVLFFCGLGEFAPDPSRQPRQPDLYRLVCSDAFQKRHPCHLFAPILDDGTVACAVEPGSPRAAQRLFCDALYAVIRSLGPDAVDTNRIYTTGLSYGGDIALDMLCSYPGRFAAALPVSASQEPEMVPRTAPVRFWLLHNRNEYATPTDRSEWEEIRRICSQNGGEARESVFPSDGHDAWRAAWAEPAVWDWLFAQTADGKPVSDSDRSLAEGDRAAEVLSSECTAALPGKDAEHGAEKGADGLEATCYEPADPAGAGAWWQIRFEKPVAGRFELKTGRSDGSSRLAGGRLESSVDGKSWTSRCPVSAKTGTAAFSTFDRVRFVRVVVTARSPVPFVVRELSVRPR